MKVITISSFLIVLVCSTISSATILFDGSPTGIASFPSGSPDGVKNSSTKPGFQNWSGPTHVCYNNELQSIAANTLTGSRSGYAWKIVTTPGRSCESTIGDYHIQLEHYLDGNSGRPLIPNSSGSNIYYYGYSTLLPTGFKNNNAWQSFGFGMGHHNYRYYWYDNGSGTEGSLSYGTVIPKGSTKDIVPLQYRAMSQIYADGASFVYNSYRWTAAPPPASSKYQHGIYNTFIPNMAKNDWYDYVIKIKFSDTTDGYIEMWVREPGQTNYVKDPVASKTGFKTHETFTQFIQYESASYVYNGKTYAGCGNKCRYGGDFSAAYTCRVCNIIANGANNNWYRLRLGSYSAAYNVSKGIGTDAQTMYIYNPKIGTTWNDVAYNSSVDNDEVYNAPIITSWLNSKTNDASQDITVNVGDSVNFTVTANQTISYWNWFLDSVQLS